MAVGRIRTRGPLYFERVYLGEQYSMSGGKKTVLNSFWLPQSPTGTLFTRSVEFCQDELHKRVRKRRPSRRYKGKKPWKARPDKVTWAEGGPLFLTRITCDAPSTNKVHLKRGSVEYDGAFRLQLSTTQRMTTYNAYAPTASSFGSQAWKKFMFGHIKPIVDLGQTIGESHEIPSMLKDAAAKAKDLYNYTKTLSRSGLSKFLSGGYLGYEFGWKPLVSDVLGAITGAEKLQKRLDHLRKYNNRWHKRAGTLRNETVEGGWTDYGGTLLYPPLQTRFYYGSIAAHTEYQVNTTDKIWFEGMLKYYMPELKYDRADSILTSPLLQKLYGLRLTPALLWELTPWSWLIDWYADLGGLISNMVNVVSENVVAKYAYVMRMRIDEYQYRHQQTFLDDTQGQVKVLATGNITCICKERDPASPFGFGISDPDFSPRQLAILAALGIQRLL